MNAWINDLRLAIIVILYDFSLAILYEFFDNYR